MEYSPDATRPLTPLPEVAGGSITWTPKDVGFGVLTFLGVFLLLPLALILPLYLIFQWDSDDRGLLLTSIVLSAPVYIGIAWAAAQFSFLKYGGGLAVLGFRRPTWGTLGWAVLAFAGAFGVSIAYTGVIGLFDIDALRQNCADQVPAEIRDDALLLALSSVLAVCFAPVCEETFFRGFAFPGIARAWGIVPGIVVSGLLFGGAHLVGNPTLYKSMIQFSLIGMVFAFVYWRSENLLATILAHTTFNVIGVIAIAATTCETP